MGNLNLTHLRLAADDDEDEHPLQCVDQIRHQPDVVRSLEHPGRDVGDPGDAHDDHQLHADSSQGSAVRGRRNQTAASL